MVSTNMWLPFLFCRALSFHIAVTLCHMSGSIHRWMLCVILWHLWHFQSPLNGFCDYRILTFEAASNACGKSRELTDTGLNFTLPLLMWSWVRSLYILHLSCSLLECQGQTIYSCVCCCCCCFGLGFGKNENTVPNK